MAYYIINVGAAPNDGTGDKARVAFQGINSNFALTQATTDALNTALAGKIGGTNPALGAATATTAATADNSTLVATTAHVKANLASYLTTSAASTTYAALGGATFTASPLVPTPISTDNTTKAANTSWVRTFVAGTSTTLPSGSLVASSYSEYTANVALTTLIPWDDTIPQVTEGTQIMSVSFTPKAVGNTLIIRFQGEAALSAATWAVVALFLDAGTDAVRAVGMIAEGAATGARGVTFEYLYTAVDTSAHTFAVRAGPSVAATMRFNGSDTARRLGGTSAATLVINEYKG
jgi:hypothetical protein